MRLLPRPADEDELDQQYTTPAPIHRSKAETPAARVPLRRLVARTAAAALPRLAYLFLFSDPENAGVPLPSAVCARAARTAP